MVIIVVFDVLGDEEVSVRIGLFVVFWEFVEFFCNYVFCLFCEY